ncbi:MAG: DUF5103 domain-containing protein [Flavobacteriales bacterium]|nr:DUF5103 domain-containing protein [Flavobacteriales bacterium]
MKKPSIPFLILALLSGLFFAFNDDDYALENYLRYDDFTYNDSIKTVLFHNTKSELSYPIINLNSGEKLLLSFDDLGRGYKNYYYSLTHCNANWTPSNLNKNEYLASFYEDEIFNYKYSSDTDVPFTHYEVVFPNENMQMTLSGNYLLTVYELNKKDRPILSRRLMVVESNVAISMNIKRATDVNESYFRQEVDFKIDHDGYDIRDPFKLNVVLMQNYRWDNAITGLKPKFINDKVLNYDYDNSENVFDAINEFRNFDIKSTQYQTMRVKSLAYNQYKGLDEVFLLNDEARSFKKYYSEQDLDGNFIIKRNGASDNGTQADYVMVHFTLPYSPPIQNGNLYLFGKFTDWKFKEEMKLDYDTVNQQYVKEVLLKQGYYNYLYCFVKDGSKNVGDIAMVEGSHYETENEYSILVYHRGVNDYYDRLVGFATARNRE